MGGFRGMEPSKIHSWEILQNPWNGLDQCIECICASWTLFPQIIVQGFFSSKTILLPPFSSSIIHGLTFEKVIPLQHFNLINLHRLKWWQYKLYLDWRDGQILKGCDGNAFVWGISAFGCVPLSSGSGNLLVLLNMICDNHQACFLDQTTIGSNIFDDCPHLVKLYRGNLQ